MESRINVVLFIPIWLLIDSLMSPDIDWTDHLLCETSGSYNHRHVVAGMTCFHGLFNTSFYSVLQLGLNVTASDNRSISEYSSYYHDYKCQKVCHLILSLWLLSIQHWIRVLQWQYHFQYFLAVANQGTRRDRPSKSVIFKWSRRRRRFREFQELVTWTARDIEYFEIDGQHYLVVANHVYGELPLILSHTGFQNKFMAPFWIIHICYKMWHLGGTKWPGYLMALLLSPNTILWISHGGFQLYKCGYENVLTHKTL